MALSDNLYVEYELKFKNEVMVPGTEFKIKGSHDIYVFKSLTHDITNDKTYVHCWSYKNKSYHFWSVDKLDCIFIAMRSRRRL